MILSDDEATPPVAGGIAGQTVVGRGPEKRSLVSPCKYSPSGGPSREDTYSIEEKRLAKV
jgi:hypothetical protein